MSYRRNTDVDGFFTLVAIVTIFAPFVAHIIACVKADWATMLILGLICFPVGWVHGVGIIFGLWG
jgi:1,4-dihydroxy-2-naphthoate octaprenyltransferase